MQRAFFARDSRFRLFPNARSRQKPLPNPRSFQPMNEHRSRLRNLLASSQMIVAPFVFDCLQAKLAAAAGFDAIYMTGFGTAAARGYPDLGLLTMTEMVANARAISQSVNVPVICDADTGYGN